MNSKGVLAQKIHENFKKNKSIQEDVSSEKHLQKIGKE